MVIEFRMLISFFIFIYFFFSHEFLIYMGQYVRPVVIFRYAYLTRRFIDLKLQNYLNDGFQISIAYFLLEFQHVAYLHELHTYTHTKDAHKYTHIHSHTHINTCTYMCMCVCVSVHVCAIG